jgi:hypothetical protein
MGMSSSSTKKKNQAMDKYKYHQHNGLFRGGKIKYHLHK